MPYIQLRERRHQPAMYFPVDDIVFLRTKKSFAVSRHIKQYFFIFCFVAKQRITELFTVFKKSGIGISHFFAIKQYLPHESDLDLKLKALQACRAHFSVSGKYREHPYIFYW
jgi:hypothetical protein